MIYDNMMTKAEKAIMPRRNRLKMMRRAVVYKVVVLNKKIIKISSDKSPRGEIEMTQ